jgi:hypothetical protein
MLSTQQHFGFMNLVAQTAGGFSVNCRTGDTECESPYTKKEASYVAVMLKADFHKFGLGL